MSAPAPVGIYDDLAASKTRITLRAADNELPGRVDVEVRMIAEERQGGLAVFESNFFKGLLDNLFHNQLVHLLHTWSGGIGTRVAGNLLAASCFRRFGVLRGDHNRMDFPRLNGAVRALQVL